MTRDQLIDGLKMISDEYSNEPVFVFIGADTQPADCVFDPLYDEAKKPLVTVIYDQRLGGYSDDESSVKELTLLTMSDEMIMRIPKTVAKHIQRNCIAGFTTISGARCTFDGATLRLAYDEDESNNFGATGATSSTNGTTN